MDIRRFVTIVFAVGLILVASPHTAPVDASLYLARGPAVVNSLTHIQSLLPDGVLNQILASGGPDLFGYTFKDSNEPGGPAYAWEEISGTGSQVTGWTSFDDGYAGPVPIGFDLDYYGNNYTELYVGSNGYINFGQGYGFIPSGSLPQTGEPDNDIALFGSDMYLYNYGSDSAVYYQTLSNPTRFVLEYVNLYYCCGQNTPHTFEVILYPNGDIVAQYQSLNGTSTSYVGIENVDGTDGLGYSAILTDSLAVHYYYPLGVFLTAGQNKFGKVGSTVAYALRLDNQTNATDSFALTVQPGHTWTITLSITQTDALSDGASLPFTVWVEIPPSASPGDVDSVTIQATSVASPTVFSDTTTITTTAIGDLAYVTLSGSNLVALVDTATHNVVGTVNVGAAGCSFPWRATVSPYDGSVYVGCYNTDNVVVIETAGNTVVATMGGIDDADDIAFTRDGAYALVGSRWSSQIAVVDTTAYTIIRYIPTPGYARSIAVHPDLDVAYATSGNGNILVIDTATFSVTAAIPVGSNPWDVAVSPDGQWVFAGDRNGAGLAVIDVGSNSVYTTVTGLGSLTGLEVAPDGSAIYVGGLGSGVYVIDGTTFTYSTTVGSIGNAWELAVTCDGSELYVGNTSDQVVVIDTQTYWTTQITLPGWTSRGIAICPQHVAPGIFLSPPAQTKRGNRGQAVRYEERLVNNTGATDAFTLTLGSHVWDTALSTNTLGPLAHGDWLTFTVYVTVPLGAAWYSTDTVIVTATSVASPTVYSDTAAFTTLAYAPPSISASPEALTSTQYVNQIATKPLTISNGNGVTLTFTLAVDMLPNGLVAYYPFNGNAHDESGNGNDGTVMGAALTSDRFGNPDSAYSFDGGDDYIQVPDDDSLDLSDGLTIMAWIKSDNTEGGRVIVSKWNDNTSDHSYIFKDWDDSDRLSIELRDNNEGVFASLRGATPITIGEWILVATTFDSNAVKLYLNSAEDASSTATGIIKNSATDMLIGALFTWGGIYQNFDGVIDDIRIYNRALTNEEILELYHWQEGGNASWLSIDPISGTVSTNSSQVISVTFDATAMQPDDYGTQIIVQSNDPAKPSVSIPTAITVLPTASMGWVEGAVSDAGTGAPLKATIMALGQPYTVTANPTTGYYKFWLDEGSYTLQASAVGYVTQTTLVTITAQQGVTQDFALVLNVSVLGVSPDSLAVTHYVGDVTTRTLTIINDGPAALTFILAEQARAAALQMRLDELSTASHNASGNDKGGNYAGPRTDDAAAFPRLASKPQLQGHTVLIIQDYYPWGHSSINQVLDAHGIGYDLLDSSQMATIDLSPYELVIIPSVQGTAFYNIWNTNIARFEAYVEDGGALWLSLTTYGETPLSPGGVINTLDAENYNDILELTHPWVAGVPNPMWGSSASHNSFTNLYPGSVAVAQAQMTGNATLVDYEMGPGRILLTGQTLEIAWASGWDGAPILENSLLDMLTWEPFLDVPWLSEEPISGTVPGYSSVQVQVTFNATGMQPGDHTAEIIIQSDDPVTPSASIPATMTVLPTPDLGRVAGSVSDAWTGLPLTATVELIGVYSMTANPDYTVWAAGGVYTLTAYTSGYYTTSRSITIVAGSLVTANLVLEPTQPRLEWTPIVVTGTAVTGRRAAQTLVISSTGPLPLEIALHEINPAAALQTLSVTDLSGKHILYDRAHGEPWSNDYSILISDTINAGAVITENWAYPIDASVLDGHDVLWVTCCGDTAWTYGELNAVNVWMSQGGAVFVQGESSNATSGPAGIYNISYQYGTCTSGTTTNITPHPISAGVDAVNVEWTCWNLIPGSGASAIVYDPLGAPHVVAHQQNGGKMVVVASEDFTDWYIGNDDNRLLANNILAWLARPGYGDVPWLSESPVTGTLPGHSRLPVSLTFDATMLPVGDYSAMLAIEHNDPAQLSPVELPVTLTVVAQQAGVSLTPTIQADSGLPGATVVYTFTIVNQGNYTDTFNLTANGAWTPTLPVSVIDPLAAGESLAFTLQVVVPASAAYGDSDTADITARSTLDPGASSSAVVLTTVAPQAAVSLAPAWQGGVGLAGETVAYTYTVTNHGDEPDVFMLSVNGVWMPTLPVTSTGSLGVSQSQVFTLEVTIPVMATFPSSDTATITARSVLDPNVSSNAQAITSVTPPSLGWQVFLPLILKSD